MELKLEVVTLAVRDVDAALAFYTSLGFTLDVDYHPREDFRVVQLTPPGSACSIQFGEGLTDAAPGSARANYLVVADLEAAHEELVARGIKVGDIRHKTPIDTWAGDFAPGPDPDHRPYATMADLADPDGNTWTLQEIRH
ncbi:VOC family protein [Kribbella sp. NBC_00709]|uniref:VOC family protein n=1 Tax=Kribbella sp. NBC_00709 TaxID=2975972 RepID=UPI002E2AD530|nr:VOC family protein [Kribbella sp. NBC_00709]